MILHSLYHGSDRKQCYYRASCLLCYLRLYLHLYAVKKRVMMAD